MYAYFIYFLYTNFFQEKAILETVRNRPKVDLICSETDLKQGKWGGFSQTI